MKMMEDFKDWLNRLAENPFVVSAAQVEARRGLGARLLNGYGVYLTILILPLSLCASTASVLGGSSLEGAVRVTAVIVALVQVVYASIRAVSSTATTIVSERQRGTLLTLALSKINSADCADGVAVAGARPLLRELTLLWPLCLVICVAVGGDLYSAAMLWAISCMMALFFAYNGVYYSAISRDAGQASNSGLMNVVTLLLLTPFIFLMGGFLAGPLWLVHPFAGLSLAFFAPGLPQGGDWFDFMMVRWWTLLVLPVYVLMIRDARRRATRALERVKLT